MAKKDCAAKVIRNLHDKGIKISKGEAEDILEAVEKRMRKLGPNTGHMDPRWDSIADEILTDIKIQAYVQRRNAKLNKIAAHNLDKLSEAADAAGISVAEAMRASTVGSWYRFDGSYGSVDAMGRTIFAEMFTGADFELRNHPNGDLSKKFGVFIKVDHEAQVDLARALELETNPNAKGPKPSEDAVAAAKILTKYRRAAFKRRNQAGAYAGELDGFIGSQTHNDFKLGDEVTEAGKAKREKWINEIRELLDPRTFTDQGIDPADDVAVKKFLNEAANDIVSGRPALGAKDPSVVFGSWQGEGSLAKKVSERHRKLHFKNADSWYEYNKAYGNRSSVIETWAADLEAMTQETAIMEKFGPNPYKVWEDWKARNLEKYGRGKNSKVNQKINDKLLDYYFDSIFPESRRTNDPNIAAWEQGILTFNNLGKLSLVAVSSLTDFVFQGAALRRLHGRRGSMHTFTAMKKFMSKVPEEHRETVHRYMGIYREGMVSNLASRMDAQGEYQGIFSKLNNVFFRLNGLQSMTNRNKKGLGAMVTGYLGDFADKKFADVDPHLQKILKQGGIDERRWDIIRKAVYTDSRGDKFILAGMVRQLDDELFDVAGSTPQREKDAVVTALNVLVNDFVESGVPTPGLKERGQLSGWQQPGTAFGMVVKLLTQFKSFPMTVWNKVIMPTYMDKGANGNMDRMGMALLAGYSILFGGAVLAIKDAIKGRSPEVANIDDPQGAAKYAMQSLLQGGALGLYADLLFQDYSRYGASAGAQVGGPTLSTATDVIRELVSKPMRGEFDIATTLRMMENHTPFLNYPGARTGFDWAVMWSLQEYLNPGYLRRIEKKAERDGRPYGGFPFYVKPTEALGQ